MLYSFDQSENFSKILLKTQKNDPQLYERIIKKINQILENPHHYKELGNVLKGCCRAHIGSFVLIFEIHENEKLVCFINFGHHDDVYD
ncbi:MAG: type II toxin-antitoxin system RelE/ParE family toxin [Candidatus Micrarchaeota archaeon]